MQVNVARLRKILAYFNSLGLVAASGAISVQANAHDFKGVSALSVQTAARLADRYIALNELAQLAQTEECYNDDYCDDDYYEFFIDNVPNPWSEDQWFEITPGFADMFPGPEPEAANDNSGTLPPNHEPVSLVSIYKRLRKQ